MISLLELIVILLGLVVTANNSALSMLPNTTLIEEYNLKLSTATRVLFL